MNWTRKSVIILLLAATLFAGVVAQHAFAQTAGVPRILSYQGRLLSASGTLLGGVGTTYCFKFSLFNASSGGSQVWPVASPSIMSAPVANGVFNIGVGDTSAGGDALTYNFQDSNSVYLNVQVATLVDPACTGGSEVFETLNPRERVVAAGYAINSATVGGFGAGINASGTMIPVISSDTLTLAGVNPQINATGTNTLTLQGGTGTGAIQFFSANNYITSSTFRINGTVSGNMLQAAVAPTQAGNASVIALGQSAVKNGSASGTFIGINTSGIFNGDYLEFENNSSTVLNVASSGQVTIGTSTNLANSLFYVATSSNIFSILNDGTAHLSGSFGINSTLTVGSTTNITADLSVGTTSEAGLFTIATSSNIFTVLANGNIGIGTTTPGYSLTVVGNSLHMGTSGFLGNVGIGTTTPANLLQVAGAEGLGVASATEGQLIFYNSLTSSTVTLQGSTSTARSITFVLPNATGTAGQSLITDGNGNLSWGSTGFTVIASTSVNKILAVTMASDTTAGITPSSLSSQVWITANVFASTTAATSSVGIGVYKTATCTSLVGSVVTSTFARASTTTPGVFNMTVNVVDAPASTTKQNYWLCADFAGTVANLSYAEITLQEIRAGSDVAEVYYAATDTALTAGDLVSLDPSIQDGVMQSQTPYENSLMGIISTQPGATLGNSDQSTGIQEIVALAGRVPVHVTNENGNINAGDYLTSSDIPGVAMRATGPGRVVAIAMQSFTPDPSDGTTTGSILGFIDVGWEPGISAAASGTASSTFSIGGDLQSFFGIVAGVGNAVQSFIQASMIAVENLFVKVVTVLPGGSLIIPSGPDQTSGVGTLSALSPQVFISNVQVTSSSKIFITPTSLTDVPLVVTSKQDGVGFTVGVVAPQANNISFDWVMVQGYHVGGPDLSVSQAPVPTDTGGTPAVTPSPADNGSSTDDSGDQTVSSTPAAPDASSSSTDATTTAPAPPADDSGGDASGTTQ